VHILRSYDGTSSSGTPIVTCQIHADGQSYIVNGLKVGASGSSSYDFEVVGTAFCSSGWAT
jgi:hypothetical protein